MQRLIQLDYDDIYREQDRSAIVRFSHKYHAEEVGAECSDCHAGAAESMLSADNNLPKMEDCYACHEEESTKCEYCHLEADGDYSEYEAPKRELIFSHQQHMADGASCESCHANVLGKGHEYKSVLPEMDGCMECHNGQEASNNCESCHSDIRFIRPPDHKPDFVYVHKQLIATGEGDNCSFCHTEESCQECHQSGRIDELKKQADFLSSYGNKITGNKTQILQSVHSLDYIFVHSIEAKGKEKDCQSCHETESFCSGCHANSAKVLRPAWHDAAGFAAGIASLHAKLARKDMEMCASCHQVDGADPICLQCHLADGSPKN